MVCEYENLANIIKARLASLGICPSKEELSKLSHDLNNLLKVSKTFDEILSYEEEPAVFFLLRVEDDGEV